MRDASGAFSFRQIPENHSFSFPSQNDRSPHIEVGGRFVFLSHAARYSERSSDSGQNADGYLKNCFPSVRFHFFEC